MYDQTQQISFQKVLYLGKVNLKSAINAIISYYDYVKIYFQKR